MAEKLAQSTWLHAQIAAVAAETIGIDTSNAGVEEARRLGFSAFVADCQEPETIRRLDLPPAELVIAGELIEHLDRPGDFLDAVQAVVADDGQLVITTPNPLSLTNVLLGFAGCEVQNADHVAWHSRRTLETLLTKHGWLVRRIAFYRHPRYLPNARASLAERSQVRGFNIYQALSWPLYAAAPSLSDGLIVVAAPVRAT